MSHETENGFSTSLGWLGCAGGWLWWRRGGSTRNTRPQPGAYHRGDAHYLFARPSPQRRDDFGGGNPQKAVQEGLQRLALTLWEISQVLWAAQGITDKTGLRAAPSAGALYPLDLYLVVGKEGVEGLGEGVYHYLPQSHSLEPTLEGDVRQTLARLSLGQMSIAEAPLSLLITAEYERTTEKYGDRGVRYVHMEAGHVGQNVYLQAEALGLGTVTIGAFQDEEISKALNLPRSYRPLYVMPIGRAQ